MVELMVSVLLFTVISTAGFIMFISSQSAWALTDANVHMQRNVRQILQRISAELQESGRNSAGTLQVTILDGSGVNGSDVVRFAVPICPCGVNTMNNDGDVQYWGAPQQWGQSGCSTSYTIDQNNKVTICHLPPGNPNNTQTLSVNENAVMSHMAHGDWVGDCSVCNPANYTNRFVEYSMDTSNRLIRKVLDINLATVSQAVIADSLSTFQVTLDGGQTMVNLSIGLSRIASQNRTVTMNDDLDVILRN